MFVQFTDSTETVVCSIYSCPQDPTAHPNQGNIAATDARYLAFIAPTPAAAAISAGLTVTSTSTPALNGTYACNVTTTADINAEVTSLMLNSTFADGTTSLAWPDASNTMHTFNVTQFKAFATALAAFVSGVRKYAMGISPSLPSSSVTIA